jgi:hypothetical protein
MKNIYSKLLMFSLLGTLMSGCSKDKDAIKNNSEISAVAADPNPLTIPSPNLVPEAEEGPHYSPYLEGYSQYDDFPKEPFTIHDKVTTQYLNETCSFDISKLAAEKSYYQLKDSKIQMAFYFDTDDPIRVVKHENVTPPALGWGAKWGSLPLVEKENPDVLFSNYGEMAIVLSKPCIEFGFELAPNMQNKAFTYNVSYGSALYHSTKGNVSGSATTPSGAKLFAITATKPFNTVTIIYNKTTGTDLGSRGFAIANIRYRIAKK